MGESDGGGGEVPVDCSVGTIVWVRRRNGSWWPGRILGPEELSASHLMSPRSGTPVKLLGRDDASVDWYNLEKSKRVKPFRCGEFDACIERVEASHGIPIKKREKYARREDAILHALELEKQQFEMKQKKLGVIPGGLRNRTSGVLKRDSNNICSEVHLKNDEPGVRSEFATQRTHSVSRQAGLSHEEDNTNNSFYVQMGRDDKEFGWEDDVPAAVPRMRALQDFGLRIAPSKRKLSQFVSWETSCEPVDNHVDVLSTANHVLGVTSQGGSRKYSSSMKSKRPLGSLVEESLVKKRDRRRPLVQVLQSSVKLPDSHSFQTDYDGGVISMQGEKDHMGAVHRAKRSRCIYLPADSNDSLDHNGYHSDEMTQFGTDSHLGHPASLAEEYTSSGLIEATESDSSERGLWEAEMDGGENLLSGAAQDLIPGTEDSDPSEFQITNKFENLEKYVMPLSGHLHLQEHFADASAEAGVSKWHMKGKRNIRNLAKRPMDANGSVKGRSEPSNQRALSSRRGCDGRYPFPLKAAAKDRRRSSEDESELVSQPGWGEADVARRRPYWGESNECFDLVYPGQMKEDLLVDVDLKVQTTYQGERVPLVSLMSRLNGKAIIGHPVQIEILEDGCRKESGVGVDESTTPPPVWKTARRTAMQRVPRSNPTTTLEDADHYPELESKPSLLLANPFPGHQLKLGKKKPHKKLPKRVSLSSQKTRTLSSIATEQNRRRGSSDILGGLIKPEGAAVPLVTCVPVKVVFSRILEAVGRPYRVRTTSPAIKDPS